MIKLTLFGLVIAGITLFAVWAGRNLKKDQLMQTSIALVILAILGSLVLNTMCWNKKKKPVKDNRIQTIYSIQDPAILELKKQMNIE